MGDLGRGDGGERRTEGERGEKRHITNTKGLKLIHHKKKDGGCQFYHNTWQTKHSLYGTKKARFFTVFVPVLRALCSLGLKVLKLSCRLL